MASKKKPEVIASFPGITGPATTAGTTGSTGPAETSEQIKADFLQNYGVQAALIASDPELGSLFTTAVSQNWSANKWAAEFQNTNWAKTRTPAQQSAELQRTSDPAAYSEAYNNARQKLISTASSLGINLTPSQIGQAIDPANYSQPHALDTTGQNLAEWILSNNPTDSALQAHLAQVGRVNATLTGGQAQTTAQQLKQQAMDLGLNNMTLPGGQDYFAQAAQGIIAGTTSAQEQSQYLINQAKTMFPAYAKQLDSGITVKALAAPYINTLSNLLEVDPTTIDLSAPTGYGSMITKALQGNGDPNNPTPMTVSDFSNQVRQDPRWLNTQNAKDSIMNSGVQLLRNFGLVTG